MLTQGTQSTRWRKSDERGQALALAAVSMVAVIAMGALAVDLGMAFAARAAAQRAADSAALAGASAFIDYTWSQPIASETAEARALEYAQNNDVLARTIDPSQVTVWVIPDSQKVRVRIGATDLPTWFARVLGVYSMDVAAVAAAVASDGGVTDQCVLPFAIADLWHEEGDPDRIPGEGDNWSFDPEVDLYEVFDSEAGCYHKAVPPSSTNLSDGCYNGTGLGSTWRNTYGGNTNIYSDVGRRIWIKAGPPGRRGTSSGGDGGGTDVMVGPGNFYIWEMPDPDMDCQGRPGANWVHENIIGCNACPVFVGPDWEYNTQTGNIASIKDSLKDLMDMDPGAYWDESGDSLVSQFGDSSPRVRIVPLWDPHQEMQGKTSFSFNNFAKIFIEGGGTEPPDFPIYARFMGPVTGGRAGPHTGSLVKYLRLVE